jgi:hypothetical protein
MIVLYSYNMESTTIRLTKKAKEDIKELMTYLSFKAKTSLTQLDVISLLVSLGEEKKEEIVEKILTQKENKEFDLTADPFFDIPVLDLGKTSNEEIDETLYGK